MTKLYDKRSKTLVDVEPGQVLGALDSGQFSFYEGQKVPVNFKGRFMYTTPEDAGKYRDRLYFANEEDVERARAEDARRKVVEDIPFGFGGVAAVGFVALCVLLFMRTRRSPRSD